MSLVLLNYEDMPFVGLLPPVRTAFRLLPKKNPSATSSVSCHRGSESVQQALSQSHPMPGRERRRLAGCCLFVMRVATVYGDGEGGGSPVHAQCSQASAINFYDQSRLRHYDCRPEGIPQPHGGEGGGRAVWIVTWISLSSGGRFPLVSY